MAQQLPYLGYCRESKENINALRNQVRQLKAAGCVKILADVQSGTQDERKFFQLTLTLLRGGGYAGLKVPRLDRLSRVLTTHLKLSEEFREIGLELFALDYGPINISTPLGWQSLVSAAVGSEYYSRQLSWNIKKGKEFARSNNRQLGGPLIFGYLRNEDRKLKIDPEKYEFARKRLEIFLELKDINKTCRDLAELGHRVSHNSLRDWLMNPTVYGRTAYHRQKSLKAGKFGLFLEISDHETHQGIGAWPQDWNAVMAVMQENSRFKGQAKKLGRRAISGLCVCDRCNKAMSVAKNGAHWKVRHRGGYQNVPCPHRGIVHEAAIEDMVHRAIARRANEIVLGLIKEAEDVPDSPELIDKKDQLDKAYKMSQLMSTPEIEQLIERLEAEVEALENTRQYSDEDKKEREELLLSLQDPDTFDEYSNDEKFAIYHKLIRQIRIRDRQVVEIKLYV